MNTPILETARLRLRPLAIADADEIYTNWASDDRVSKYVRWSTHQNVEETKQWLETDIEHNKSIGSFNWGFELKQTGKLIGSGGIFEKEGGNVYELGYVTMYDYWNQGYTTEAAKAILEFGIQELHIHEYVAWHAVDNPASGRVMEKCGFVYEKNEVHTKFDGVTSYETKSYRLIESPPHMRSAEKVKGADNVSKT